MNEEEWSVSWFPPVPSPIIPYRKNKYTIPFVSLHCGNYGCPLGSGQFVGHMALMLPPDSRATPCCPFTFWKETGDDEWVVIRFLKGAGPRSLRSYKSH